MSLTGMVLSRREGSVAASAGAAGSTAVAEADAKAQASSQIVFTPGSRPEMSYAQL
jgi:hypothetical protein